MTLCRFTISGLAQGSVLVLGVHGSGLQIGRRISANIAKNSVHLRLAHDALAASQSSLLISIVIAVQLRGVVRKTCSV